MVEIKELPADKYEALATVFRDVFNSDLPSPKNSTILVAFDAGKFAGFVLAEQVLMIGQMFAVPEASESGKTRVVNALVGEVRRRYENKEVVGAVASEPRFENLYSSLGLQKIDGVFYRRNIACTGT